MDYVPSHGDKTRLADRDHISGARYFDGEDQGKFVILDLASAKKMSGQRCFKPVIFVSLVNTILSVSTVRLRQQVPHATVTIRRLDQTTN